MGSVLYIKDPMILINGMDPYFKKNEPDCTLFSQNKQNIQVHKEVLYQTKLLREMISSVDSNSKIEIICTSIDKEELEIIVKFLYSGEISCQNQNTENQVSRTLSELFGFPPIKHSSNLEEHLKQPYVGKKFSKQLQKPTSIPYEIPAPMILENDIKQEVQYENLEYNFEEFDPLSDPRSWIKREHVGNVHEGKKPRSVKFKCHFCATIFTQFKDLKHHLTIEHEGKKPHNCSLCDAGFILRAQLNKHFKAVHEQYRPHKCLICNDKGFFEARALRNHISVVHEGKKPYNCEICNAGFDNIMEIKTHLSVAHEISGENLSMYSNSIRKTLKNTYTCPECKEIFETANSRIKHVLMTHPETKIHNCLHCDKAYLTEKALSDHQRRIHGKESVVKSEFRKNRIQNRKRCPICKEIFESKNLMMSHYTSMHPEARTHRCTVCNEQYQTLIGLRQHMFKVHEKKLSIRAKRCPICKEDFESKNIMMNHYTTVHGAKSYHCSICNEQYRTLEGLAEHTFKVHERKVSYLGCSFCGKEFASKKDKKNHIVTDHKEKLFECTRCDFSHRVLTSLQKHIEQVHERKTYQCTTCGEEFATINRYGNMGYGVFKRGVQN